MSSPGKHQFGIAAALILIGLNLRPAVAAVPPLLHALRHDTGLSSAAAGLLTAVPVLCFGLFALATSTVARRIGLERLLLVAMAVAVAGIALRLLTGTVALFAGTTIAGAGLAVGNVCLPALIKQAFPDHVPLLTALYLMALSGGAALAAGLTVPLRQVTGVGWRPALAVWGIPALLAVLCWLPFAGGRHVPGGDGLLVGLLRDRLAWQVTVFMGLQSLGFYATLTWLPTLFADRGLSAARAGWMLSYASLVGVASSLLAPVVMRRSGRPRLSVGVVVGLCALGLVGLIVAPRAMAYEAMTLLGLGQGAAIALALTFIGLRAPDARHAAALSTMAQGVGYLVASLGPFGVGAIHDRSGGWDVPLVVLIVLLGPELLAGLGAAANRHVLEGAPARPGRAV